MKQMHLPMAVFSLCGPRAWLINKMYRGYYTLAKDMNFMFEWQEQYHE